MVYIQDRVWFEEAMSLAKKSKYAEKVIPLLKDPSKGRLPGEDSCWLPNCFGSLFYVIGIDKVNRPRPINQAHMRRFLEEYCTQSKNSDGIVAFSELEGYLLYHVGLFIGTAKGVDIIFHQPDTGEDYTLSPVSQAFKHPMLQARAIFYSQLPIAKDFFIID